MLHPVITSESLITDAIKVIVDRQIKLMQKREEGTIKGEDIEELHQMRVAIRRMRAALALIEPLIIRKTYRQLNKGLRFVGRTLGSVRDLDVFCEYIKDSIETQMITNGEGLQVNELAETRLVYLRIRMTQSLRDARYHELKVQLNTFTSDTQFGVKQRSFDAISKYQIDHFLPITLYKQLGVVQELGRQVDQLDFDALHDLRIEIKKLRYTLEFFDQILGDEVQSKIKTLKKAQDYLGKLNDMRVALEILPQIFQDEQNLDEGDGPGMRNNLQMKMRDIFELEKQNSIIGFPRFWVEEFDERFWGELEDQIRQI